MNIYEAVRLGNDWYVQRADGTDLQPRRWFTEYAAQVEAERLNTADSKR